MSLLVFVDEIFTNTSPGKPEILSLFRNGTAGGRPVLSFTMRLLRAV